MKQTMKSPGLNFNSIEEYVALFPKNIQAVLQTLRTTIKSAAPDAEERISYRMPTFFLKKNLVHFAAFKNHIGFFPTSSGVRAFEKELSKYNHSTGSIQFPLDKPLPLALVRKIVKFRVSENLRIAVIRKLKS
jgi:uncharacterized protein YdhG (YjbR/CyaY superfamily)